MLDFAIKKFKEFRQKLRDSFPNRKDALLELTDAIAGNIHYKSPVALSLSALFSRKYSSVHDGVDNFFSTCQFRIFLCRAF